MSKQNRLLELKQILKGENQTSFDRIFVQILLNEEPKLFAEIPTKSKGLDIIVTSEQEAQDVRDLIEGKI